MTSKEKKALASFRRLCESRTVHWVAFIMLLLSGMGFFVTTIRAGIQNEPGTPVDFDTEDVFAICFFHTSTVMSLLFAGFLGSFQLTIAVTDQLSQRLSELESQSLKSSKPENGRMEESDSST